MHKKNRILVYPNINLLFENIRIKNTRNEKIFNIIRIYALKAVYLRHF